IPQVTGVGLPLSLLLLLKENFPKRFAGIKDSSGDYEYAKSIVAGLGKDSLILVGNDKLLGPGLKLGVSGCITSFANLSSPLLREIWDGFQNGEDIGALQDKLNAGRAILESYTPFPSSLKGLLQNIFELHEEHVRPPLLATPQSDINNAAQKLMEYIK
ncbi:MAG: dihydrodipicolinate synthase family protein, partial [Chloroflexota bacterium]